MASIIKADNIQKVSDGSNIIKKCGSTITLGSCGATISLAAGATQTGFGRTGTVDWCTTIKTAPFTAVNGDGFFVNTTSGTITVTLPATPTAGDIIALKDYGGTWQTNAVTLCNNGNKINGVCATASLSTQNQSVSLIYVDGTKGWQDINDSTSSVAGEDYITATGGTITCCGDYKIHTFTSDGCFAVTASLTPANNKVDYLVIAGGAGAGNWSGGGGGAGGYRESKCACVSGCWTASPLATPVSLPVSSTTYPITVGAGGSGQPAGSNWPTQACNGSNSVFSTITSTGGGAGGSNDRPSPVGPMSGFPGGSAGGGSRQPGNVGGAGNTPPTSPPQGNNGGSGLQVPPTYFGGGGGGAGAVGNNATPSVGGNGGAGATSSINGTPTARAGGGGGGTVISPTNTSGGTGGGGNGGAGGAPNPGTAGTVNTGGGGGAAGSTNCGAPSSGSGGSGGSGVVIIRYKFQ
jgi:hypothetical protein